VGVDPPAPCGDLRGEARVDEERRLRAEGGLEITASDERREIARPGDIHGRYAKDLEIAGAGIDLAPELRGEGGERLGRF